MPRIISMARSSPTRSSVVRCSDTSAGTSSAVGVEAVSVAMWRLHPFLLRRAWLWPAFAVFTVAEGVLLNELPVWGSGPQGLVPGILIAGFLNLIVVAV